MKNESKEKYCGCIYLITNNANGKRYVGQTINNINTRLIQHMSAALSESSKNTNIILYRAIRKYGRDKFTIEELEHVECDTQKERQNRLNELEVYYISEMNTYIPNGYNMTLGGQVSEERVKVAWYEVDEDGNVVKYFNSTREAERAYNITRGSIWRASVSNSHYVSGRYWYRADKYDIKIGDNIGSQHNSLKKTVYQFDLEGKFLRSYESANEASRKSGVSRDGISKVALGRHGYRTAGGYIWSFTDKLPEHNESTLYAGPINIKPIIQLTTTGEFVNKYDSAADTARSVNGNRTQILNCAKGIYKTSYGYKWVYSDKYTNEEVENNG